MEKNSNPGIIFRGVYCLYLFRKDSSVRSKRKGQLIWVYFSGGQKNNRAHILGFI